MALLVSDIIDDVRTLLIDTLKVRWPDVELINWLNDAARQIVVMKPDSNPSTEEFTCVAGAKQTLPAGTVMLFDIPANTGADESAVTFVSRKVLDSERPTWRNTAQSAISSYYMYDEWQRDNFYLYPPATVGSTVEVVLAKEPTKVTALTDAFPLQDIYGPIVTNYIIWRAYSKDSDFSGNLPLTTSYYQAFVQGVTGKIASEEGEAPKRNLPPNIAPGA